ncbi:hypothetical protein ABW19_dt0202447 [Dactylella cylindrospora]|nr:hypothetical protein ABW19_dt0202447 [Dactylella cylindrospora]
MQTAARAVAFENERLRELLYSVGVSRDGLDRYLNSCRNREPHLPIETSKTPPPNETCKTVTIQERMGHDPEPETDPISPGNTPLQLHVAPSTLSASHAKSSNEPEPEPESDSPNLCSKGDNTASAAAMETSCKIAAKIISQMRGNSEEEAVYSRLGCEGGLAKTCTVKNTVLFQLMDEV